MNNKLLIDVFRSYLSDTSIQNINDKDIEELIKLSNSNKILPVVSHVLNSSGYSNDYLTAASYKAALIFELQNKNKEELRLLLKDYDFVFFKGSQISKYYKESYERVSADIDIFLFSKFDEALNVLANNGYTIVRKDKQEYNLLDKNNNNIDLHKRLSLDDELLEEIIKASPHTNNSLTLEYEYLFLIYHSKKHLLQGILDLRVLLDIYYLRNKVNRDLLDSLLLKTNLKTFDDSLNHYLDSIINGSAYNKNDTFLEEFIFNYVNDEGINNRILINSYNKSKISYLFSRVFISYDLLKNEYPIIDRVKILTPIYYVVRIFKILRSRRNSYAYKEIRANMAINNKESIIKMHENLENIGILV